MKKLEPLRFTEYDLMDTKARFHFRNQALASKSGQSPLGGMHVLSPPTCASSAFESVITCTFKRHACVFSPTMCILCIPVGHHMCFLSGCCLSVCVFRLVACAHVVLLFSACTCLSFIMTVHTGIAAASQHLLLHDQKCHMHRVR